MNHTGVIKLLGNACLLLLVAMLGSLFPSTEGGRQSAAAVTPTEWVATPSPQRHNVVSYHLANARLIKHVASFFAGRHTPQFILLAHQRLQHQRLAASTLIFHVSNDVTQTSLPFKIPAPSDDPAIIG